MARHSFGAFVVLRSTARKTRKSRPSLKIKGKAKSAAGEFESMFLNTMFEQMFTNVDGDGPIGGTGSLKVWRSFMTDQYAQMFAKGGGIGLAGHVYDELLNSRA